MANNLDSMLAELLEAKSKAQESQAIWAQQHRRLLGSLGANIPPCLSLSSPRAFKKGAVGESLKQPSQVVIPLREYQLQGVAFLAQAYKQGISAILGDEMGLGKTMQTIAYIAHLRFDRNLRGPHLILCPVSVMSHWMDEFARACPQLRVVILDTSSPGKQNRGFMDGYPEAYDVLVTSYGIASSLLLRGFFLDSWWRTVVLDEGHIIKNENTKIAKALRKFQFVQAVILTGTPLQCNLHELWALLNFLYPEIFPSSTVFDKTFQIGVPQGKRGACDPSAEAETLRRVHDFLQICMLRRMKNTVEAGLLDKVETWLTCPISELQTYWYRRVVMSDPKLLKQMQDAAGEFKHNGRSWQKFQGILAGLQKVCNHPYLLPGIDPNSKMTDDAFVDASGKFQLLDRIIKRLLLAGHRCTVFSQFTTTLDMIARLLQWREVKFCRIDGSMNYGLRSQNIREFQAIDSEFDVFLLSTRAGGLGINLQSADTCIIFDSDWNPQMDLQAMSRVHRIGQSKRVHVYRLVSGGTVEERIVQRAQKRLYLDRVVNHDNGAKTMAQERLTTEEWMNLIELKESATVGGEACHALSDNDLDSILDRNRAQDAAVGKLITQGTVHSAAEARVALEVERDARDHRQEVEERAWEEFGGRPNKLRRL